MQYNFSKPDEVMTKLIKEYPDLTGREIKQKFDELEKQYFQTQTEKNQKILDKFKEIEGKTLYFIVADDSSEMEIYKVSDFRLNISVNNGTSIDCNYQRYYIEREDTGEYSVVSNIVEYTAAKWFISSPEYIQTTEEVWKKFEEIFSNTWSSVSNLVFNEIYKNEG